MSIQTLRILIGGGPFAPGVGPPLGFWRPTHSWLLRAIPDPTLRAISSVFWVVSAIGFVAAAAGFFGVVVPQDWWRILAVVFAVISLLGLVLFIGNWPAFNTLGAVGFNIATLVALLWLHWPPETVAP